MKESIHIFQGLKRDNHQIRQGENFLWNAHNIRLTSREDSTDFSVTNERGTEEIMSFEGNYVGHCVFGKYLVVFTSDDYGRSTIYRVEYRNDKLITLVLYNNYQSNDMWDVKYPIETLGVSENELINKVYWIDGIHQPRVINITKAELLGIDTSESKDISEDLGYDDKSFDFVKELKLEEEVSISKLYSKGIFASGTIQYAFTYYNKYEQESNIFYISPLYYISTENRGGSPEEVISNAFKLEITNFENYDYIRVYSIHRTSENTAPEVKVVVDLSIKEIANNYVYYIDNGTSGYTIDPTQLLYIGGETIIPKTFTQKDNTLFFGHIKRSADYKLNEVKKLLTDENYSIDDYNIPYLSYQTTTKDTYYDDNTQLSNSYSGIFKTNEYYRCGIQVQYSNGKWSDPIFVKDMIINDKYPWENKGIIKSKAISLEYESIVDKLIELGIRKIRACVVYPDAIDRNIICQGVLCPTVFSVAGRRADGPYATSSWFFRPATSDIKLADTTVQTTNNDNAYTGASIQYAHNYSLLPPNDRGAEIQSTNGKCHNIKDIAALTLYSNNEKEDNIGNYNSQFFVDENIITMHSPDLEFDESLKSFNWKGTELNIIGMVTLKASAGDINIQTSSPPAGATSTGFIREFIGFSTKANSLRNGGLVSGGFYKDCNVTNTFEVGNDRNWMVYPWQKSGSLNDDRRRPSDKGIQSSVLQKKIISNLKYFSDNKSIVGGSLVYDIEDPKLFNSDTVSLTTLNISYLNKRISYFGNVDDLITKTSNYSTCSGGSFASYFSLDGTENTSDPIRMKYKSSPHLVFSLKGTNPTDVRILPRHEELTSLNGNKYNLPEWQYLGSKDESDNDFDRGYKYLWYFTEDSIKSVHKESEIPNAYLGYYALHSKKDNYYRLSIATNNGGTTYWELLSETAPIVVIISERFTITKPYGHFFPVQIGSEIVTDTESNYDNLGHYTGEDRYYLISPVEDHPGYWTIKHILDEEISNYISDNPVTNQEYTIQQDRFSDSEEQPEQQGVVPPYLLLAEIRRTNQNNDFRFGGLSKEALESNIWFPASPAISIYNLGESRDVIVPFLFGDSWYTRYDCLKTYPFTKEDENQIIEIGSFMCESRINLDGRYDNNKGQISNLYVSPSNFNLINTVYSQKDNFFSYRIYDEDYYKTAAYPNQIIWSKEKHPGEEIDTWTNITLANSLDLPSDRGELTSLQFWNETLLGFQERALSQIMFNSRVQIPVTDGVPIEISNNYKVDGYKTISDTIGCYDKWAIKSTSSGVYFIDKSSDGIYIYDGKITPLGEAKGLNWWTRKFSNSKWSINKKDNNGIRIFNDAKYNDVYFSPGKSDNQEDAACYSEKIGQFTSFMSYGGVPAMFNFGDGFYSINSALNGTTTLYRNNTGNYNNFYGEEKGWDISFIENKDASMTKIFDTIELRADIYDNGSLLNNCPINYIKAENEYQKADAIFNDSTMRKKFRVWRGIIPRNNNTRERIRNTWSMFTIGNDSPGTSNAVIHDVSTKYTI